MNKDLESWSMFEMRGANSNMSFTIINLKNFKHSPLLFNHTMLSSSKEEISTYLFLLRANMGKLGSATKLGSQNKPRFSHFTSNPTYSWPPNFWISKLGFYLVTIPEQLFFCTGNLNTRFSPTLLFMLVFQFY